ncbi:MAG: hypothetical protein ABJO57_10135 [Lentilitoribacter sp.]
MEAIHQQVHQVFTQYAQEKKAQPAFNPNFESELGRLLTVSQFDIQDQFKRSSACRNAAGESIQFACGYVDEGSTTAFSDQFGEYHIIGMDITLANVLHKLALKCFSDQDFFPEIGLIETEGRSQLRTDADRKLWLYQCLKLASYSSSALSQDTPSDTVRLNAANYLTLLMLRFIWFHEMNHGLLGHTSYLQSLHERRRLIDALVNIKASSFFVHEFDSMAIDATSLQYMELEADNAAFRQCFRILNGNDEFANLIDLTQATRCRLGVFAQFAITWIFDLFAKCLSRFSINTTHPKPSLRLAAFYRLSIFEVEDLGLSAPAFVNGVFAQFHNVFGSTHKIFRRMSSSQISKYQVAASQLHSTLEPFRYQARKAT